MSDQTSTRETLSRSAPNMTYVSVVVPVYAGEDYLQALVEQLTHVSQHWDANGVPACISEILLVDDASIDSSSSVISRLSDENPVVSALYLSRNFGQHPATIAGILHSSGDWVVTMDEDLQHDPKLITELLHAAVSDSADIVYARPSNGKHKFGLRDQMSSSFKWLMSYSTGDKSLKDVNSFRVIRGEIARAAASVCAHETYLDIALSWFTNRRRSIAFEMEDVRFARTGKSGYSFRSLLSHARRMALTSNLRVLRTMTFLGFLLVGISAVFGIAVLSLTLFIPQVIVVRGWASLMLAQLSFSGITLVMLGIIMEYISVLVLRAHGKPVFFTIDRRRDDDLRPFLAQAVGA